MFSQAQFANVYPNSLGQFGGFPALGSSVGNSSSVGNPPSQVGFPLYGTPSVISEPPFTPNPYPLMYCNVPDQNSMAGLNLNATANPNPNAPNLKPNNAPQQHKGKQPRLFGRNGSFTKSSLNKYNRQGGRLRDKRNSNASGDIVLRNSTLDQEVLQVIDTYFTKEKELDKNYIEDPAVRLLEEISPQEAILAIKEFVERFMVAKHKIKKSRPGYFRGVCQKYWKKNRDNIKQQLLEKARSAPKSQVGTLSGLVKKAVEMLFTPASGLETSIIDESVEKRLTRLTDEQAIEALYEFCWAVMYRQDRIKNINAYLMNIIKRRVEKSNNEASPQTRYHRNGTVNGRPPAPGPAPTPVYQYMTSGPYPVPANASLPLGLPANPWVLPPFYPPTTPSVPQVSMDSAIPTLPQTPVPPSPMVPKFSMDSIAPLVSLEDSGLKGTPALPHDGVAHNDKPVMSRTRPSVHSPGPDAQSVSTVDDDCPKDDAGEPLVLTLARTTVTENVSEHADRSQDLTSSEENPQPSLGTGTRDSNTGPQPKKVATPVLPLPAPGSGQNLSYAKSPSLEPVPESSKGNSEDHEDGFHILEGYDEVMEEGATSPMLDEEILMDSSPAVSDLPEELVAQKRTLEALDLQTAHSDSRIYDSWCGGSRDLPPSAYDSSFHRTARLVPAHSYTSSHDFHSKRAGYRRRLHLDKSSSSGAAGRGISAVRSLDRLRLPRRGHPDRYAQSHPILTTLLSQEELKSEPSPLLKDGAHSLPVPEEQRKGEDLKLGKPCLPDPDQAASLSKLSHASSRSKNSPQIQERKLQKPVELMPRKSAEKSSSKQAPPKASEVQPPVRNQTLEAPKTASSRRKKVKSTGPRNAPRNPPRNAARNPPSMEFEYPPQLGRRVPEPQRYFVQPSFRQPHPIVDSRPTLPPPQFVQVGVPAGVTAPSPFMAPPRAQLIQPLATPLSIYPPAFMQPASYYSVREPPRVVPPPSFESYPGSIPNTAYIVPGSFLLSSVPTDAPPVFGHNSLQ